MKLFYCGLLLLCHHFSIAQPSRIHSLTIGSSFPAIRIEKLLNNASTAITIGGRNDKILIIHFLLTTCSSCIESSRKYDSLLKAFPGELQALIVTSEPKDKVQKFMSRHPGFFGAMPVIYSDSKLRSLFPYYDVSHVVWINPAGKVAAITDAEYVTAKHIRQLLDNTIPQWPVKEDLGPYDTNLPFLTVENKSVNPASLPSLMYYTSFCRQMKGLPVGKYELVDTVHSMRQVKIINQTIPETYMRIYGLDTIPFSHILIQATNKNRYYYTKEKFFKAGWDVDNTWCYEARVPMDWSDDQCKAKMLSDLNDWFGTSAILKDTTIEGLALVNKGKAELPLNDEWPTSGEWMPLRNIVYHLNDVYGNKPAITLVPELSEKTVEVSLDLLKDLPALNKKLGLYGLTLEPYPVNLTALIIQEKRPFTFSHTPKLYTK